MSHPKTWQSLTMMWANILVPRSCLASESYLQDIYIIYLAFFLWENMHFKALGYLNREPKIGRKMLQILNEFSLLQRCRKLIENRLLWRASDFAERQKLYGTFDQNFDVAVSSILLRSDMTLLWSRKLVANYLKVSRDCSIENLSWFLFECFFFQRP